MKKHEVIINMTNNTITFWLDHYIYIKALLFIILNETILSIEIMLIISYKILFFIK